MIAAHCIVLTSAATSSATRALTLPAQTPRVPLQHCEGARPDDPAIAAAARGRGDPI